VDRYAAPLLRLAAWWVGNAADAEDIVQETLTGAFRALHAFRGGSSVRTWLARILVRQAAAHHRRRKRAIDLLHLRRPAAEASEGGPAQAVDARIDVSAAIRALSREHREVVVLREMQGLSYEEIAEVLGIPRGTVESRLFRARRELAERLKEYVS
jgi:RNA polymerase sigma-70 factor (ECF subfamily)